MTALPREPARVSNARDATSSKIPPSVGGAPLIGALFDLLRDAPGALLRAGTAHPGELISLDLGIARAYLATKPDHVQHILSGNWRNYGKGTMLWRPLRRLLGDGLLTSEGDAWSRSRKLLQPLFTQKQVAGLVEVMIEIIGLQLERAAPALSGEVDIGTEMLRLTQQILLGTMMSTLLEREGVDAVAEALDAALAAINLRVFLYFVPEGVPLPGELRLRRAIETIDATVFRIIEERRLRGGGQRDLLSLLMDARDDESSAGLSDRQLRDQVVTIFLAGYETSAVALTWVWYLLDQHPEAARRLRDEVDTVLGGRRPTFADIANLRYTWMVIQETMRLYPPAWLFPRFAHGADVIDGYPIPAGSTVLLSPYVTHRLPTLWDRPDAFEPERFSPERAEGRHRFAHYPFGGGPRQCIGMYFAMAEMQLVIAMMVQRYRFHRPDRRAVTPKSVMTLRPRDGIPMIMSRR